MDKDQRIQAIQEQDLKETVGAKATITIHQQPEGLAIGLDFHGEKLDLNAMDGLQKLALVGVDAMRDYIRENFNVRGEEVVSRDGQPLNPATTH